MQPSATSPYLRAEGYRIRTFSTFNLIGAVGKNVAVTGICIHTVRCAAGVE